MPILEFQGEYRFLSNFWYCELPKFYIMTTTIEHYYQSEKFAYNPYLWTDCMSKRTPAEAKTFANQHKNAVRQDWQQINLGLMWTLICEKFSKTNPELRAQLKATGDQLLVEGNAWHDNFFGKCTCLKCKDIVGQNHLGLMLMERRDQINGIINE